MGSVKRPRGRLPQRVYWTRRLLVVGVALALVFGIARLLGTGGDPGSSADQAISTGSKQSEESTGPTQGPVPAPRKSGSATPGTATPTVLASPSGTCAADELTVMPEVRQAAAGGPIVIDLELQGTQPACTFQVDPDSLVVKVASGKDRIWSSQDCPRSITKADVVVRSGTPTTVPVTWSGRRSDDECSRTTAWALPGFYHVYSAALGSTPTDLQFEVTLPKRPVETRTAKPKPTPTRTPRPTPTVKPNGKKSGGPSSD